MRTRGFLPVAGILLFLHLYIGTRLYAGVASHPGWQAGGVLLLLSLLVLLPLGLFARAIRRQPLSDRVAWAGLLAMGFFSSLLVLTVGRDVLLVAAHGLQALQAMLFEAAARPPAMTASALSIDTARAVPPVALLISIIGFVNARRVARVVRVDVPIPGLPPALAGFLIAQVSDIHVGPTIKGGYLDAVVDVVNGLRPDVIAITGDLVDGSVKELAPHTAPLHRLSAVHGAYFVTGNHEYYSNAPAWIAEVRRLGVTVLLNQHVVLPHGPERVLLAGVTDFGGHHFDELHRSDPLAALAGSPPDVGVKILLAHQPRSADAAAAAGFDLQLSGHTHGGQFFPWNLFVPLQQPFTAGLHRLRNLWVYTSRGTGYWGPPKRFGAPSEITLLRLVAGQAAPA